MKRVLPLLLAALIAASCQKAPHSPPGAQNNVAASAPTVPSKNKSSQEPPFEQGKNVAAGLSLRFQTKAINLRLDQLDPKLIQEAKRLYKLEVLQSLSERQTIYLIGEQHLQNSYETLRLGHEILNTFKYRALEFQPHLSEYWSEEAKQRPVEQLSTLTLALRFNEIPDPKNPEAKIPATNILIDTADSATALVARHRTEVAVLGIAPALIIWTFSHRLKSSLFAKSLAAVGAVLAVNVITALMDLYLGGEFRDHQHKPWFKYLFPNFYGLVTVRDQAMALEIDTILHQRPEIHSLLVVVGADHLPGLVQNLSQDYGFRLLELPEVKEEQTVRANPATDH